MHLGVKIPFAAAGLIYVLIPLISHVDVKQRSATVATASSCEG